VALSLHESNKKVKVKVNSIFFIFFLYVSFAKILNLTGKDKFSNSHLGSLGHIYVTLFSIKQIEYTT